MMIFGIVFKKGRKKKFQILPPLHFAKKKKKRILMIIFLFLPIYLDFFLDLKNWYISSFFHHEQSYFLYLSFEERKKIIIIFMINHRIVIYVTTLLILPSFLFVLFFFKNEKYTELLWYRISLCKVVFVFIHFLLLPFIHRIWSKPYC